MKRSSRQAFLPVGAAMLVIGVLGQPAFLAIGGAFLAIAIVERKRPSR